MKKLFVVTISLLLVAGFSFSCKKAGGSMEEEVAKAMNGFADAVEKNQDNCDAMGKAMGPHAEVIAKNMAEMAKKFKGQKEPPPELKGPSERWKNSMNKLGKGVGNKMVLESLKKFQKM